jgi:hypothetical protein
MALLASVACAGLLLAGCSEAGDDGPVERGAQLASPDIADRAGSAEAGPPRDEDAAALVQGALDARAANRPTEFAVLLSAAGKACPDPGASRRLGEVAGIAARWSSALQDGRPKAQAVTEAQLADVDWDALMAACLAP